MGNSHDFWTDRLSDYLDNELTVSERAGVDGHLHACAECREALDELRAVALRARSLSDTPPSRELWPGIAAAIGAATQRGSRALQMIALRTTRRFSFTLPQLVAASLALMLISGGMVWMARLGGERTDFPPVNAEAPPLDAASLALPATFADAHYDQAIADLQQTLEAGRDRLDAETVRVLEQNLAAIDRAIDQCRRALAADPANRFLSEHLVAAKKRKLGLLRIATAMAEGRT